MPFCTQIAAYLASHKVEPKHVSLTWKFRRWACWQAWSCKLFFVSGCANISDQFAPFITFYFILFRIIKSTLKVMILELGYWTMLNKLEHAHSSLVVTLHRINLLNVKADEMESNRGSVI